MAKRPRDGGRIGGQKAKKRSPLQTLSQAFITKSDEPYYLHAGVSRSHGLLAMACGHCITVQCYYSATPQTCSFLPQIRPKMCS